MAALDMLLLTRAISICGELFFASPRPTTSTMLTAAAKPRRASRLPKAKSEGGFAPGVWAVACRMPSTTCVQNIGINGAQHLPDKNQIAQSVFRRGDQRHHMPHQNVARAECATEYSHCSCVMQPLQQIVGGEHCFRMGYRGILNSLQ
jgi:hypothetical protein